MNKNTNKNDKKQKNDKPNTKTTKTTKVNESKIDEKVEQKRDEPILTPQPSPVINKDEVNKGRDYDLWNVDFLYWIILIWLYFNIDVFFSFNFYKRNK